MEWLTINIIWVKKVHKQDQRYTDTQKEISHLMHTTDIVADQLYFNIKKAIFSSKEALFEPELQC